MVQTSELGLEKTDVEDLCMRLFDEVTLLGGRAKDVRSEIDPSCVTSDSCLRDRGDKFFVSMSVTRIGPLLQVELRMLPPSGDALVHRASVDSIANAVILSAEMRALLRREIDRVTNAEEHTRAPDIEKNQRTLDSDKRIHFDPPPAPPPAESFPLLGVGLASVGTLTAVGFGALAGLDALVLSDPNSLTADKDAASQSGPLYLAGAALGAITLTAGTVVLLLE